MTDTISTTVPTITIDNKPYTLDTLTEQARAQIINLQAVEAEIAQLQRQLAIAQTARSAYASVLKAEIAKLG